MDNVELRQFASHEKEHREGIGLHVEGGDRLLECGAQRTHEAAAAACSGSSRGLDVGQGRGLQLEASVRGVAASEKKDMLAAAMRLGKTRVSTCLSVAVLFGATCHVGVAEADGPNCSNDVRNPRCVRALDLHDDAQRLYAEGRYRDALVRLDEAVTSDPNGGQLYFNLGKIHELLGEFEPALVMYRRALELESNPAERDRLQAMVKRVEGAQVASERETSLAKSLVPARPIAPPPMPRGPHPLRPWMWVSAGTALSLGVVGGVLAGYALRTAPGAVATTGDGVTIEQLQAAASRAEVSALAAEVTLGLAAVSAVAAISIGIFVAEVEEPALVSGPRALASSVPARRGAALSIDVGPTSAAFTWRFQ